MEWSTEVCKERSEAWRSAACSALQVFHLVLSSWQQATYLCQLKGKHWFISENIIEQHAKKKTAKISTLRHFYLEITHFKKAVSWLHKRTVTWHSGTFCEQISANTSHILPQLHISDASLPLRCRWRLALEEPSFPPSLSNTQGQHHVHTSWCWSTSFHAQALLAVQLPEDPRALFEYRGDTECKATNAKGYRVCFHIPPYSSSSQTKPSLHLANVLQAAPLGNTATSSCSQYSHDHQPEIRWYSVPIQGYHARPEHECLFFIF